MHVIDLDKWLHGLESQIQSDDYGKDLTSVNILLKKQQASGCFPAVVLIVFNSPTVFSDIPLVCEGILTQHSGL